MCGLFSNMSFFCFTAVTIISNFGGSIGLVGVHGFTVWKMSRRRTGSWRLSFGQVSIRSFHLSLWAAWLTSPTRPIFPLKFAILYSLGLSWLWVLTPPLGTLRISNWRWKALPTPLTRRSFSASFKLPKKVLIAPVTIRFGCSLRFCIFSQGTYYWKFFI